ncbi:MAG: hypothetical protein LBG93_04510 [Treponema sp.]|jgi:hypothetical protein|nr:hypothetical protein [Treponema sp.]
MFAKSDDSVDLFWEDFEDETGETVLAKSSGKYLSGWDEYPEPLWGLIIATSGGFHFQHFPNDGGIFGMFRPSSSGKAPKKKTFLIKRETIIAVEVVQEKRLWKRLLFSSFPHIIIRFENNGEEKKVIIEVDRNADSVADALKGLL